MSERLANDAYFTPPALAEAIVQRLLDRGLLRPGMSVWEPHAGSGSFVRPLIAAGLAITASDLEPLPIQCGGPLDGFILTPYRHNAADGWRESWGDRPDWIIGNPPFGEAEAHVRALLPVARCGVAFITRQSFASTAKRADLTAAVWQVWPISPRPSFTGGATDAAEYNVLVWRRQAEGPAPFPLDPLLGWR